MSDKDAKELSRKLHEIAESLGAIKERLAALEQGTPYPLPYYPPAYPYYPAWPSPYEPPYRITYGDSSSDPGEVLTSTAVSAGQTINVG